MNKCTLIYGILLLVAGCGNDSQVARLQSECRQALREAAACSEFWVRVHAVEYLAGLGYTEEARQFTTGGLAGYEQVPEKRIGFWRCQYRVSGTEKGKKVWLDKIRNAYLDSLGPDRVHAAETLSKLGYSLKNVDAQLIERDLEGGGTLAAYVRWGHALPLPGDAAEYKVLLQELEAEDENRRKIAAYGLSFTGALPGNGWKTLAGLALREPPSSQAYPYLLGASCSLYEVGNAHSPELADSLRRRLLLLKDAGSKEAMVELCRALAVNGHEEDYPLLTELLRQEDFKERSQNLDVRAAAAYALMKLENEFN